MLKKDINYTQFKIFSSLLSNLSPLCSDSAEPSTHQYSVSLTCFFSYYVYSKNPLPNKYSWFLVKHVIQLFSGTLGLKQLKENPG